MLSGRGVLHGWTSSAAEAWEGLCGAAACKGRARTAWVPFLVPLSLNPYPLLYSGTSLSNLQQILWQGRVFSTRSHLHVPWYLRADSILFVPVSSKCLYKTVLKKTKFSHFAFEFNFIHLSFCTLYWLLWIEAEKMHHFR